MEFKNPSPKDWERAYSGKEWNILPIIACIGLISIWIFHHV
jgi:hypothetical protein